MELDEYTFGFSDDVVRCIRLQQVVNPLAIHCKTFSLLLVFMFFQLLPDDMNTTWQVCEYNFRTDIIQRF